VRIAVIIPVKSFTVAKGRLSDTLTATQRQELAQSCAESVVMAARSFHTYVACSDSTVASWAISHGAHVVHCPTPGLDAAVAASRVAAQHDGFTHVIVAHADLPLAETFQHIAHEGSVSAVPDRHRDGTNVLSFPIDSTFVTAYGPGSFDNHKQLAQAAGLPFVVVSDTNLELDLDTADDLTELTKRKNQQ
jgi:2-phospho-L-lactate guanylyltransferase